VDDEEKGILDLSAILNDQGNTFDGAVTVKDSSGNIIVDKIYGGIQPAINDASNDNIISVGLDKYTPASAVEVDKSLTIKSASESNPIIDASGNAHGIEIPVGVSGVTINGLSISDSNGQGVIVKTESSSPEPSEPSADNHDNIEIRSNILSGHGDNGIYVGDTNSVTIVGNTLQNNGGDGEFDNAGNGVLLVGGNKDVNVNNNKFDANVDSGLYLDDFAGSGQTIPSVEGNEFTGHSEADFRIESASAAGSINGENDQSGQLQYVIDNNDITTTNPATVSDVQLTNPDQKQLDLSVTTTGDVSESNLVVQLSSSTDSTGSDVTITAGEFSEIETVMAHSPMMQRSLQT
jgi:parallel beta-helix repeat protein